MTKKLNPFTKKQWEEICYNLAVDNIFNELRLLFVKKLRNNFKEMKKLIEEIKERLNKK